MLLMFLKILLLWTSSVYVFFEIICFYISMQHYHKNAASHILFSYVITSFLCEVQLLWCPCIWHLSLSLQTALTVGNTSNAAISAQPYQSNTTISLPSHPASVASPIVPTLQIPSPPLSAPTPNLVKPSLFFVPPPSSYARMMQLVSSSTPTAPPLNPPLSLQRPYGAPVLQPFPPPTPPPSLTPALTSNSGPFISKEKVRETLLVLVQVRISGYANARSYNCIWHVHVYCY